MAELPKDEPEVSSAFLFFENSVQKEISMTMDRLKHIHLALMVGISLFIPLFLVYSFYVDLSKIVLLSSDMSYEDPEDEALSNCQNEIKIFPPKVSYNPLLIGTRFGARSCPFSSPLTISTQNRSVLRC
jgi:hypothetical protein